MSPKATSASRWKLPCISDTLVNTPDTFVPFLCITETWLKDYITDAQISIDNYNVFRADRASRIEGGALIYVHDSLLVSNVERYDDKLCQAVIISIDTIKTVVACVYRPPDSGSSSFRKVMKKIQEYLDDTDPKYDKVITGDFNLPNINWDTLVDYKHPGFNNAQPSKKPGELSLCAHTLLDFMGTNFLAQIIDSPTRGRNILDLVMVSTENTVDEISVEETKLSDHNVITVNLGYDARSKTPPREPPVFDPLSFRALKLHEIDSAELDAKFDEIDWDSLFKTCEACYDSEEERLSAFAELVQLTVLQVTLLHTPEKKPVVQKKKISRHRSILYRKKRKLNARLKCLQQMTPRSPRINKINTELSLLEIEIRDAIEQELYNKEDKAIKNIKENPSFFFSYAKQFAKTRSNVGPLKETDGDLKHQPEDMANILQSQYSSVFSDPDSADIDPTASNTKKNINTNISNVEVTTKRMIHAMSELNANSSAPDGDIPAKILKDCRKSLCKPLVILWQNSFDIGIIPTQFKQQFITPIFKKGNKTDPANYRPVSLTSHVIKIFERVIRTQLVEFLENNKLISAKQHGFRKGRSCLTQLLSHMDQILENYLRGDETDVIYLDYAKAFDKVDHKILLHKLSLHGIHGRLLDWLSAFLLNREQVVVVDGEHSRPAPVLSGVPQGTVLGPILFIIYINDLENVLTDSQSSSFADDTRMSKAISCTTDTTKLQNDLNAVVKWSLENNMKLHEDKFELLCYRNTAATKLLQQLPFASQFCQYITPAGFTMSEKRVVRDLGVLLSSDLSWTPYIAEMVKSARNYASWVLDVFRDRS